MNWWIPIVIMAAMTLIGLGEIRKWPGSYRERNDRFRKLYNRITVENIKEYIKAKEREEP